MQKVTLNKWQSALLHGVITFVGSAIALYLAGHPDLGNMTIAGIFAAVWNVLQNIGTSEQSA